MLGSISEAFTLYRRNFLRILLIGLLIVIPVQVIYTIVVNYVSMPFLLLNIPLWPTILQSIFMLMALFVMIIPMISLAVRSERQEKATIGKLFADFLKYAFFVYLASIPIAVITTAGFLVFIIPGILSLIFLMGIPFVKVIENDSISMTIKKSFSFGKENFVPIFGLLLTFAVIDFIGTYIFSFLAIVLFGQMAAVNWAMIIFNMFLLPLFVLSLAKLYFSWNGESDFIREDEYHKQLELYR